MPLGRANTPVDKFTVMIRLLDAWQKVPYLRLGQFLVSALPDGTDLFYAEDAELMRLAREFADSMKAADDKEGPLKEVLWEEDGGTMTMEQFREFVRKHNITWEVP